MDNEAYKSKGKKRPSTTGNEFAAAFFCFQGILFVIVCLDCKTEIAIQFQLKLIEIR
ncbi:conserved hypothetical protein [Ricinus communis]|uniref:Uncharacterized protein n=1 Tax=Ricinus communis TaxID=3988 RepID=B9S166_RICCO|nr:conserved hypothetical protein [Ricinus communis]